MEAQQAQQALDLRRAQINLEMVQLRQEAVAAQTPEGSPEDAVQVRMQALEVELAQIALEETQLNQHDLDQAIADAQISAPFDGKVLSVSTQVGSEVRAYAPLLILGDDREVEIGATLTTAQMEILSEGMPAVIELPARPGERLSGVLRSLPFPYGTDGTDGSAEEAQAGSPGSTRPADANTTIALSDPEQLASIRVGDLVNVTIVVESKTAVLWLPPAAIRTFGDRHFVVLQTEDLPRRVDVEVGIANEERIEIIEGLEEGQRVIAP
jgi:macrolide-specific efflux system membrane fusion protein